MIPRTNWKIKLSETLKKPDFTKKPESMHAFIIESSGRKTDRIASVIEANQGKIHRELGLIPSLVIEFPYAALEELAHLRPVKKIWHDAPVYIRLDVAVPTVGGTKAHELSLTGKDVVIAVLDTGIYPHLDFITPENRIIAWHDFMQNQATPYDDNGHGTHVAGIIGGNGYSSNGKYRGMAPEALLVGVKVLDKNGAGTTSNVLSGIEWCLANCSKLNIKAINFSIGSPAQASCQLDPLCRAVTTVWKKGLVVIAAAGNEGPLITTIDTPGINPFIITVGNVDDRQTITIIDDQLSHTSSRGPTVDQLTKPDLLAPGTGITSTWINKRYQNLSGTSMSTPMVTGAIALIIQKWPSLKPNQIKKLLMSNARSLGLGANLQGAGVLDLEKTLSAKPLNQLNHHYSGELLGYHLLDNLLKRVGINPSTFRRNQAAAIKKA